LSGLDLQHSYWIDPAALKKGNLVVVCGGIRRLEAGDPLCATQAKVLFGTPDKTAHLSYQTYDPHREYLGRQTYDVLLWKPRGKRP
jgi:hypothetical protein